MDEYVIYDDNGVIESGPEDEMRERFDNPDFDWTGDLTLALIMARKR